MLRSLHMKLVMLMVLLILSLLFLEKDNFEKFEPGSPARRRPAA